MATSICTTRLLDEVEMSAMARAGDGAAKGPPLSVLARRIAAVAIPVTALPIDRKKPRRRALFSGLLSSLLSLDAYTAFLIVVRLALLAGCCDGDDDGRGMLMLLTVNAETWSDAGLHVVDR